jgi:uncharacterized membrane protein
MPTQDAPYVLIRKLAGVVLLIFGGLVAAYGVRYGETATAVFGGALFVCGLIVLIRKIVRRNQGGV